MVSRNQDQALRFASQRSGSIESDEKKKTADSVALLDRDTINYYYDTYFPFDLYYEWLNYGYKEKYNMKTIETRFTRREFAVQSMVKDFGRYISFDTLDEFKKYMITNVVLKLDVGAIYEHKPKLYEQNLRGDPIEKEFVIDVDASEYDDVRTCCQGGNICQKCWIYMEAATQIIQNVLIDVFCFTNILWLFSGRRGIHCWVADCKARVLSNSERQSIILYLDLQAQTRRGNCWRVINLATEIEHPHLQKSIKTLTPLFESRLLFQQDILATPDRRSQLLSIIEHKELESAIAIELNTLNFDISENINIGWKIIKSLVQTTRFQIKKHIIEEMILTYLYPRPDIDVSKSMHHLLKGPYSPHPGSGKMCLPIQFESITKFNPNSVPTISELVQSDSESSERVLFEQSKEPFKNFIKKAQGEMLDLNRQSQQKTLLF